MLAQMPLILLSVTCNALAQVLLKKGMLVLGPNLSEGDAFGKARRILFQPYVIAGLACFGGSLVTWLIVLSTVEVSAAYPLYGLGYIITAVAGRSLFDERLSAARWIGIALICVGVGLVAQS